MAAPLLRACSTRCTVLASMFVSFITPSTALWSTPPSVANSFWYSMSKSAVFCGLIAMDRLLEKVLTRCTITARSRLQTSKEAGRSVAEQGAGDGAGDDEERLLFEAVVGAVLRLQRVVHGV